MANVTATSASYDANANQFFVVISGANSGDTFDLTKFTFTGANGESYTAQASTTQLANGPGNVSVGVYIAVAAADQANVNRIFNANGDRSSGSATADYSLAVGVDFDTTQAGSSPAASGIGLTVQNWALPSLTSATYNATNGQLVVTGTHLVNTPDTGTANDITASKLQLTGQGGSIYTLTSTDVEVGSSAGFTVQLNATDIAAIKAYLNKNTTTSLDNTTYKLSALAGWDGATSSAIATTANVGITVSGFPNPAKTFSGVTFSSDTGSSATDLITNVAAQTISGTTSGVFTTGDFVQASVDGGTTWITGAYTSAVNVTPWTISGVTLSSSSTTLLLRVVNPTGAGPNNSKTYALDQTAPTNTVATIVLPTDSGVSASDGITNAASQTITGTLASNLAAGELVQVSLDGGSTWNTATATVAQNTWSYAASFSAGSNALQVRVADTAGNGGTALPKTVVLDTTAPVFASATVNGNSLVVSYTEAQALDATNVPANGAFTVQVGGAADAVTGVAVNSSAKTVTLTLATAATAGQVVTVAYNDPTGGDDANAVQDTAGNDAVTITAQAVTNNTLAVPAGGTPSTPTIGVTLTAPPGGGTVTGTTNNDTLIGQDGNDTFFPGGGRDVINGGGGTDTVVLAGGRSNYTVTHNSNGSFTLQSKSDPNTILNLTGIERVKFDGQTIALDVTANSGKAADMYALALGRNPEDAGLVYWANTLDKGLSDVDLARSFVNSKEFATLYGSLSDTAFITQFYQTAFRRAPEAAGLAYFQDLLSHVTGANGRANLLATFVDSAEMQAKLVGQVDQGIPLLATA